MVVVDSLLRLWKAQEHRVLIFSQSKAMLDIVEKFVRGRAYTYQRMDGTTPISIRQPLVNKFNTVWHLSLSLSLSPSPSLPLLLRMTPSLCFC